MSEIITKVRSRNIKTILTAVVCQSTGGGGTGDISGTGTTNEVAYFTAAKTIASLPVATYPNLTELALVKGLIRKPSRQLIYQNTATLSNTGSVTENLMDSILIPANTLQAGDVLFFTFLASKSGAAGNWTARIRVHTSAAVAGTQLLIVQANSNQLTFRSERYMGFKSTTSQVIYPATLNVNSDTTSGTLSLSSLTNDYTQNQYFIITLQNVSAADTTSVQFWSIELIRS